MSISGVVKSEKIEHVMRITIDRPEAFNALNSQILDELTAAFSAAGSDDEVRAVILTGSGEKAFIAGADIKEMMNKAPHEARAFSGKGHLLCKTIEDLQKPVIAAVNGVALGGGCEIACACDIRIASDKARFGQPEVGLGIMPGWGGTVRLARVVGQGIARQMIFTGKPLKPEEALRVGLVNAVVPADGLAEEAMKLANAIAAQGPFAVSGAKRSMNKSVYLDTDAACEVEMSLFGLCFSTVDQKAGMAAFIEKRAPEFQGR